MKGTLRRRILSTFLSLAMIISMLGISVITVSAVTDDRVVEIHIKDVVRDNSFAADLVNEINQQRAQLGTNWPALKLDTLIEEEAMVRAAELPILTSKVDLLFRPYGDDGLEGSKYLEAVVKTTADNAYDVIQEILNDPMQASTIKDQKVTELGVGVITINEDTGTKFVCIRTTNEKSNNNSLQEMSVTALRNKGTQELVQKTTACVEALTLDEAAAAFDGMSIEQGKSYPLYFKADNYESNGSYAYLVPSFIIEKQDILDGNTDGVITGKAPGSTRVSMILTGVNNESYVQDITINVTGKGFETCSFNYKDEYTYTGSAIKPNVTIREKNGTLLTEGTDYTLSYSNNIRPGTATITVSGLKDHVGKSWSLPFYIRSAPSLDLYVSASIVYPGDRVNVSLTGVNGIAPYTYTLTITDPDGGSNVYNNTTGDFSFTAGKVGQYSLSASLVDSDGVTASKEAVVRSVDQLSVEFKSSKYIVQLGSQIKVETNTVGGASPLTYTFEYEDGTVVLKDSSYSSVTIKPTAAGERKLYVYAKDANGNIESASTTIVCNAALSASLDPDASKIYVGDSTNVTLNVTGGCQPLTYEFRDKEGNLLDSDEETMIYTPTEAGDYVIIGKVTDAVGDSVISQTTISTADPLEVELYSEKPNVIIGSYVNIKANVSGGFPTIKYKYTKDDGSSISGTTSTLSYRPPAVGDHIINVTVTDGIGTISTDTITVSAAVKPDVTLDSDKTVVYTGEKITFTATGTGGFDPASYEFEYSDGTPVPSHDGVAEIIPDTPGSYIMEVTYLDRYGYYASKRKNFTVVDPLEVDLQASQTRAVVNEKISFNAITSGGYSTLTYKYALADGTAVSGSTGSTYYTPKAVGDYTLIVTVTDKIGTQVTASVDFTVEPALTINSSAESLYVNLGDQTTITSEAAGGYAPLTYSFDLSDGTPLSSNGNTAVFRPTEEGSYVVNCRVTDDAGHTQLKTLTIKSAKELSIDFDITQTEVISGTKVTYTTTAHDGFPKFTYKYAYSDGKSISGSYSSGYVNPSTPGEYTIIATVTDLGGNVKTAEKSFVVAPKMTITPVVSDDSIFLGEAAEITTTGTGGFPPYTYIYEYVNSDDSTTLIPNDPTDPSKAYVRPDENGEYTVRITMKDRNDNSVNMKKTIRVADKLILSADVSATEIFKGETVTFTPSYVGGFDPVTISYSCTNGGSVKVSEGKGLFTPTKPGEYVVTVTAKDKYSNIVSIDNNIEVVTPLTLTLKTESDVIDKGEPFTITAQSTGGFEPVEYSFRFSSDTPIYSDGSEAQLLLTTPDEYTIICEATDRKGNKVDAVKTITICDPLTVDLIASEEEVLSGTKVTLTAVSSGAYQTTTYKFTKNGSSQSSTNGVVTFTPTSAGEYTFVVTATDKAGRTATAEKTIIVAAAFTETVKASVSQASPGETVTFTATSTGGFEPITYSFAYEDGTEIPSDGGNTAQIVASESGNFKVIATAADNNNHTVSAYCTFSVVAPLKVKLTASQDKLVVGEKVTLTTTAEGGIPTYTYSYAYEGGTSISGTGSSITISPKTAGTYTVVTTVKDKAGTIVPASATFTVADKLAATLTASKNNVYLGETVTLTADSTGGFDPISYSFAYEDDSIIPSSGNTATIKMNSAGVYNVKVTAVDATGHTATASQKITASGQLSVKLTPSATKAVVGTKITLNTDVSGGFTPMTYKYEYVGGSAISGTGASASITPSAVGYYTVKVTVTDSTGDTKSATAEIEITNKLTVSLTSQSTKLYLGESVMLNATANGGVDDITYTFKFDDGTVLASNGSRAEYTPEEAGSKKITVYAEDKAGNKASAYVTINAAEKLTASFEISDTEVVPNTTVSMTLTAEGGFPTLSYKFTASNGAKVTVSGNTATSLLTLAGDYEFTATVTDKAGKTVTFKRTVKVVSDLQVSFTASAYRIFKGDSITFTAEATGGTEPITFSYAYADGTKITTNGNQAVISPENGGYYTVIVTAKDKYGNTATAQTNVMVEEVNELNNTSTISATNIPLGSSVTLTGSCTGGASPYTYNFYYKKARNSEWLRIRTDETSCKFTPTSATSYDIKITVTDRRNATVEKNFSLKAEKNLENTSTVSSDKIVVGKKIVITGSAAGGAGGYQYAFYYKKYNKDSWTVIGDAFTTKSAAFRPGTAIDYDVRIVVKDLDGAEDEKIIRLSGNKPLTNESTVNSTTVIVGNKIVMKGAASGGIGAYKYAFYYKKASKTDWIVIGDAYTTKSAAFRPGSTVPYDVKIVVMDENENTAEKTYRVSVVNEQKDLENRSTVSSETIVLGERVFIIGNAEGGTAPYTYKFSYKKSKNTDWVTIGTAYTTESASFKPSAQTDYDVRIIVKDAAGVTAEKSYVIAVTVPDVNPEDEPS